MVWKKASQAQNRGDANSPTHVVPPPVDLGCGFSAKVLKSLHCHIGFRCLPKRFATLIAFIESGCASLCHEHVGPLLMQYANKLSKNWQKH